MRRHAGPGLLVRRKRGTCSGNEGMGRMKRKMMMMMMKQNHVYVTTAPIGVYANRLIRLTWLSCPEML